MNPLSLLRPLELIANVIHQQPVEKTVHTSPKADVRSIERGKSAPRRRQKERYQRSWDARRAVWRKAPQRRRRRNAIASRPAVRQMRSKTQSAGPRNVSARAIIGTSHSSADCFDRHPFHGLMTSRPQPANPSTSRVATAAPATQAVAAIKASKASMGFPARRRSTTISA